MIYELFEWLLTVVMTSEEADYYNGQQGDMWDAQKDMALAMIGSSIVAVLYLSKIILKRIKL
jgi:putative membrane protein